MQADNMESKKSYGLILPAKAALKKRIENSRMAAFEESSDSDDSVPKFKRKPQIIEHKKARTPQSVIKALAQDPKMYEYDEVYEEMEVEKEKNIKENYIGIHKKPRYIHSLLLHAEKRKREAELRKERQVQKEREAEGNKFADKEAYVTESYRKKMEELAAEAERENQEKKIDVTRQKDLSGFYRHLYRQTMGEEISSSENVEQCVNLLPEEGNSFFQEEKVERSYRKQNLDTLNQDSSDNSDSENENEDSDFSSTVSSTDDEINNKEDLPITDEQLKPEHDNASSPSTSKNEIDIDIKENVFSRRNYGPAIEAYRQRYLQRKALYKFQTVK